ncbi:Eco29kI family restriction endonuclease [Phormidium sp. CCY1219]|uniref:Eco29kI family restriction endonuclease n=1 Tax=Phormidium sp. CCY1219 TaxID=2886104 RepID=UPI002D1F8B3B|nr:Eco29kI family restriction endonuclease [Phormidium sp. CCY1219]MEB3828202.1 Eco29kI family restriction endonuclease [Phormidium sp. CCY1219]
MRHQKTVTFNPNRHIFRSPKFRSVVNDAIQFFCETPVYPLPPTNRFIGAGVYGLYYLGDCGLYARLADANKQALEQPIYIGKAVPPGWRTARTQETQTTVLYRRLREHARSIEQVGNLQTEDFNCRFTILTHIETDLIGPVEAELIRRYQPLWNCVIDGFGNHDPGSGRYNQAPSEWDVLHPGRPWAERLTGVLPSLAIVTEKVGDF